MSWEENRDKVIGSVRIQGLVAPSELRVLYDLAGKGEGEGEIVEIGSWRGLSTVILAKGLKMGGRKGRVYAVDPHSSSDVHIRCGIPSTEHEFRMNLERYGVSDVVTPMVMKSEEAAKGWNKPIRLLFVDGDHSYEAVKKDIEYWYPHVITGGTVVFHDFYGSPAGTVKKAVEEWLPEQGKTISMNRIHSSLIVIKVRR